MSKIVFIFQEGKPIPVFMEEKNGKIIYILPSGKQKKNLRVFARSGKKAKYEPSTAGSILRKVQEKVKKIEDEIDDRLLWELSVNETAIEELVELYFGERAEDERKVALFNKLSSSKFFRRKGENFIKRSQAEIEEIEKMEKALEKKGQLINKFLDYVKGKVEKDNEIEDVLKNTRQYIIKDGNIPQKFLVESLMRSLGIKRKEGLISLLERLGEWSVEEEPLMERLGIDKPFKAEIIAEGKNITPDDKEREEYGETVAIDDVDTIEVDDSISIEKMGKNYIIGVHVTDLAAFIPAGSNLDKTAFKRAQTVYLPEGRFFMLPEELVKENYTLSEERPSRALSLFMEVSEDFRILKWWFKRTWIRVKRRTYEESEKIFQGEFDFLLRFFTHRKNERIERGAIVVNIPEVEIKVKGEEIEIKRKEFNTPAHLAVQEAMIIYNEKAAEFLAKEGVPAIYRIQPFEVDEKPRIDENDPLFPIKIIPYLRASHLTTHPQPHLSLGVNLYTQVTSPLRRFGDLIIQRQLLKAMGIEEKHYSRQDLLEIFEYIEERAKMIKELVRARKTFWIMKYLTRMKGHHIEGYYSRLKDGRHMVFFPQFMLEIPVNLPWKTPQREGQKMVFKIKKIDLKRRKPVLIPVI